MRAVVQRVTESTVRVDGQLVGQIGRGFLVLLGVGQGDTENDARLLADKIVNLRVFPDELGRMNLDLLQTQGEILVVSQFTLFGDCRKGRRPAFTDAAEPQIANRLYQLFCQYLGEHNVPVAQGVFAADMQVHLVNDGPVTLLIDSRKQF